MKIKGLNLRIIIGIFSMDQIKKRVLMAYGKLIRFKFRQMIVTENGTFKLENNMKLACGKLMFDIQINEASN